MSTENCGNEPLDLAAMEAKLRERLEGPQDRTFWRSLDELAQTPRYEEFLLHEFGDTESDAGKEKPGISRRDALKLMAASAAFAGLAACTRLPTQKIVPYVRAPEDIIPGKPLFYATAMPQNGVGLGLLVESHMGRPTKIEGNPEHPASLGATNVFAQAAVLTLYDPDRSQVVTQDGRIASWERFVAVLNNVRDESLAAKGEGLRILTETITSPSLGSQLQALLAQFPKAKWHQYDACGSDAAREGARMAFGEHVNVMYRLDQADVILSLDSDFLTSGPVSVRYARDFVARRNVETTGGQMNRLYVVESTPSNTGAMADHRLPLKSRDIEGLAGTVAGQLGVAGANGVTSVPAQWIAAVTRDLKEHRGRSLVLAGDQQPPAVHALALAMNEALGNIGTTVVCTQPIETNPVRQADSIGELAADMKAGRVRTLLILGGNPVYTAPADLEFGKQLFSVPLRIRLGLYADETSELCNWHVPEAHFLESWGDVRTYDGTATVIQPLISPLYNGKSPHDLLAALLHQEGSAHEIVKDYWKDQYATAHKEEKGFESFWETSLHDGYVAGTAFAAKTTTVKAAANGIGGAPRTVGDSEGLEIVFRPDPTVGDGSFANSGWLQELPKPQTHLVWDNAALMSAATAQRLGVTNEDYATLQFDGREVNFPVWVMPGHPDDSVTVHLGYGRLRAGNVGTGVGSNAYALRSSRAPWFGSGLKVQNTGKRYYLATTQFHHSMEREGQKQDEPSVTAFDRDLVRVATLEEFKKNPEFAKDSEEKTDKGLTLYPGYEYKGYAWGMSIDLNRCTGCNACVVACQSENNISVVGKDQVRRGRAMHWIRIDTYFRGGLENPETYHEPVVCMHCEDAPCEVVCPVGATMHSPEGLNEMVYNRCVGTRYCSNNCPYKVRRFNFLLYADWETPSLKLLRNPNVSVRSRGVMEKCTYCVQRINAAKIESEKQDRQVRDGEIVTACQGACPAEAIVFGNINDPNSRVAKLKAQTRNFGLLEEINTRPRTTYLAKLRNPNPEIKG